MFENFKPGDEIRCTVTKKPIRDDALSTVRRLMRFDPDIKRALKKVQEHRMRTLHVRSRGKRPWEVRRKASKLANPEQGVSWTMPYFPQVRPDFESVADYVKVEKA